MDNKDTISIKDADSTLIKRLEKIYGEVDMENDFLSGDLQTYYKTDDIDPQGDVQHKIIRLAGFGDSLSKLSQASKALKTLISTAEGKSDTDLRKYETQLRDVFNKYRTHMRKNYPDQYLQLKGKLEELSTSLSAGSYNIPKFVDKKKLKEDIGTDVKTFHQDRMAGFDKIGDLLGQIQPLLIDAKQETEEFYKANPLKQEVLFSTDIIEDYLNDIIKTLRPE